MLSLDDQARRSYEQYSAQPTNLARNDFLAALRDRNEVLYYKLLEEHLQAMLPVVYDPVVAQAIERYSHEYQRPDGVYLSIDDIDGVDSALANYGLGADDVDLLVATDAEAILGIGDWGVNGFAISVGKLAVYTAAAGIDPDRVIPVSLDVGTDTESLLNDPHYVGNRHSRVRGERYDAFVDAYVKAATKLFPKALALAFLFQALRSTAGLIGLFGSDARPGHRLHQLPAGQTAPRNTACRNRRTVGSHVPLVSNDGLIPPQDWSATVRADSVERPVSSPVSQSRGQLPPASS